LNSGGVTAVTRPIMSHASTSQSPETPRSPKAGKHEGSSDANIRNFAPVARIMKTALPENAKIAKEAKECMQECVSEFISFITSEGTCGCETQGKLFVVLIVLSQPRRSVIKRNGRLLMARIFCLL